MRYALLICDDENATTGPDGEDKVHLSCGYGHEVQIRRGRIIAALAAAEGVTTISL